MKFGKNRYLWQVKWHVIAIYIAIIVVFCLSDIHRLFKAFADNEICRLFSNLLILAVILVVAIRLRKCSKQ